MREFLVVVMQMQFFAVFDADGERLLRRRIALLNASIDILQLLLDVKAVDALGLRLCRAAARSVLLLLANSTHFLIIQELLLTHACLLAGGGNLLVGLIGRIVVPLMMMLAVAGTIGPILDLLVKVLRCRRVDVFRVLVDLLHFLAFEDFFNRPQIICLILVR